MFGIDDLIAMLTIASMGTQVAGQATGNRGLQRTGQGLGLASMGAGMIPSAGSLPQSAGMLNAQQAARAGITNIAPKVSPGLNTLGRIKNYLDIANKGLTAVNSILPSPKIETPMPLTGKKPVFPNMYPSDIGINRPILHDPRRLSTYNRIYNRLFGGY